MTKHMILVNLSFAVVMVGGGICSHLFGLPWWVIYAAGALDLLIALRLVRRWLP